MSILVDKNSKVLTQGMTGATATPRSPQARA
jgi:succinyl-CoA synthetase alpha subunit